MEPEKRKLLIALFTLDGMLVAVPVVLSPVFDAPSTDYLPGILVLALVVNLWAFRKTLIPDVEQHIALARMRPIARRADGHLYGFVDELTSKLDRLRDGEHGMPVYEETLVTRTSAEVKKYAGLHRDIRDRARLLSQ